MNDSLGIVIALLVALVLCLWVASAVATELLNGPKSALVQKLGRRRSVALIVVLLVASFVIYAAGQVIGRRTLATSGQSSPQQQIVELDNVKASLQKLVAYVESQQSRISESQIALESLTKEKAQLEPVVQAQRDAIDQLFLLQEQRNQRTKIFDMAGAFLLGVVSSLVASLLLPRLTARGSGGAGGDGRPKSDA